MTIKIKNNVFFLFHLVVYIFIINADYIYGSFANKFYLYNLRNILFIQLLVTLFFNFILNKKQQIVINNTMVYSLFFLLYMFLSWGFISPARDYGGLKLIGCAFGFFLAIIPNLMNYNYIDIKKFFNVYLILNLLLVVLMLVVNDVSNYSLNSRLQIGEINPIWLARLFGEIIILIIFILNNKFTSLLKYSLLTLLVFGIVFTGSKGPLFSLILALCFVNITTFKIRINKVVFLKKYLYLILLVMGMFIFIKYILLKAFSLEYLTERFIISNSESSYGEYSRIYLYKKAFEYFTEKPIFGNGLGAFGYLHNGYDTRDYPHNMILESLSELGLVGSILLGIPIVLTTFKFFKFIKVKDGLYLRLSMTLFLYYLFNSLVSGDFGFGNIRLFIFMGILNYIYILISNLYQDNGRLTKRIING